MRATLSVAVVIEAANSRARITHCESRAERRSATSDVRLDAEKFSAAPTFKRSRRQQRRALVLEYLGNVFDALHPDETLVAQLRLPVPGRRGAG